MPHSGEFAFQGYTDPYTAPSLLGAWVNYGAGFSPAGYYKSPDGVVHLRGLIKDGVLLTNAFILPVGYRPTAGTIMFPAITSTGVGRLDVLTTGEVLVVSGGTPYFSLSGIDFRP